MKKRSGSWTMFMSVLMSSPGPIVVGLGLMAGRSATQLADFVRRSAELMAIIVAFVVYQLTGKETVGPEKRQQMERRSNLFVGAVMCLSGCAMLFVTLTSPERETGNVIPGLSIAVMGVIANCIFWLKYARLSRKTGNSILAVQSRLYRAKTMVDGCVTVALTAVALFPASAAAERLDFAGSVIVAVYLVWCGVKTIREHGKNGTQEDVS